MNYRDYNKQFQKKKRGKIVVLVAFMAVIALFTTVFFAQSFGENEGYRTVSVIETSGNVSVVKDGIEYRAYPGMLLQEGYEIVTSANSYVRMVLDNDKYVKLESGSRAIFETLGFWGSGKTRIRLERGALTTEITKPLQEDEDFVINTPNAVLAVRGTFFRVDLSLSGEGEVKADVMTYGGKVASQRVLPTGEKIEEEVLIESGFKASINMTQEDTYYVVETEDGEDIIIDPVLPDIPGEEVVQPTMPIVLEDISDDDLVDVYFAAENGHELFVTVEEVKKDLEEREINIEEHTSVYEKAEEIKNEQEANATVKADDSQPISKVEEDKKEDTTVSTPSVGTGLVDGNHIHRAEEEITEATCETEGIIIIICKDCKETIGKKEIPALGHTYANDFTIDKAATCTEVGSKSKHCAKCDAVTEVTEIAAKGHEMVNTSYVEPGCEKAGSNTYTCDCGYSFTEEIKAFGHKFAEDFTVDKEATCTEAGSKSKHCTKCDATAEVIEIAAVGHKMVNTGYVAPSCTKVGSNTYTCDCGYSSTEEIKALGHKFAEDFTVDKAATCTEAGSKSKHCTKCDAVIEVTEIAAVGHEWSDWFEAKEPTCEEEGIFERQCTNCHVLEERTEEAFGHKEVNGGWYNCHKRCSVCEETTDENHVYRDEYVAPTCKDIGLINHYCDCGYVYSDIIDKLPHTEVHAGEPDVHTKCSVCQKELSDGTQHVYTITILKNATCTENGLKRNECACGWFYEEEIPAFEHNYVNVTDIPTETENGRSYQQCTKCEDIIHESPILALNAVNFPDDNFRTFLEVNYNTDGKAGLTVAEIEKITKLDIAGDGFDSEVRVDGGIKNLTGIAHLVELQTLDVSYNRDLLELDLSNNRKLVEFYAQTTGLTKLELPKKSALRTIDLTHSRALTQLDLSETFLENVTLSYTSFTGFSQTPQEGYVVVPNFGSIVNLNIKSTRFDFATLGEVNEAWLSSLKYLNAQSTNLTVDSAAELISHLPIGLEVLDISYHYSLKRLDVSTLTSLKELNLEGFSRLEYLNVSYTALESLNTNYIGWLKEVYATDCSQLKEINLVGSDEIEILDLERSAVTELDLTEFPLIGKLNIMNCESLESLTLADNSMITLLDLRGCSNLRTLHVSNCENLTELDVTPCFGLEQVIVAGCGNMTRVNASSCDVLQGFDISGTRIENVATSYSGAGYTDFAITISHMACIKSVNLSGTTMYFTGMMPEETIWLGTVEYLTMQNANLTDSEVFQLINYMQGAVKELDFSNNTAITQLDVTRFPSLVSLNVSGCTSLTNLDTSTCTQLTDLNVSNTPLENGGAHVHTPSNGGTQNVHSVCLTCGEVLSTQHEMINTESVAATCSVAGSMTYRCDCGYTYTNEVAALGHSEATEHVIETLESPGHFRKYCYVCNVTFEEYDIEKLDALYVEDGDIQIREYGYMQNTQVGWFMYEGDYPIAQRDPSTPVDCTIYVESGDISIDLDGLNLSGGGLIISNGATVRLNGKSHNTISSHPSITNNGNLVFEGGSFNLADTTALSGFEFSIADSILAEENRTFVSFDGTRYVYELTEEDRASDGNFYICQPMAASLTSEFFEDYTLLTYVAEHYDTNNDGYLSNFEVMNANSIELAADQSIQTLAGIEYLPYLDELIVMDASNITDGEVDVRNNSKLVTLRLVDADITELDLSNNLELAYLVLNGSNIKNLDVSSNPLLESLSVEDCTELATLNASGCNLDGSIQVVGTNNLETINISNSDIRYLSVGNLEKLHTLNVAECSSLSYLSLDTLPLLKNGLEMGNCTELAELSIVGCDSLMWYNMRFGQDGVGEKLTSLTLDGTYAEYNIEIDCEYLENLSISNSNVDIELLRGPNLKNISYSKSSMIDTVQLSECSNLEYATFYEMNALSMVHLTNATKLKSVELSLCSTLGNMDFNGSFAEEESALLISECGVEQLILSGLTNLTQLRLENNERLGFANIGESSGITSITVYGSPSLYEMNLTGLPSLESLAFEGCTNLPSLDLSNCTKLSSLGLSGCETLYNLDLTACDEIEYIDVMNVGMNSTNPRFELRVSVGTTTETAARSAQGWADYMSIVAE